jgi:hypothetical protein
MEANNSRDARITGMPATIEVSVTYDTSAAVKTAATAETLAA